MAVGAHVRVGSRGRAALMAVGAPSLWFSCGCATRVAVGMHVRCWSARGAPVVAVVFTCLRRGVRDGDCAFLGGSGASCVVACEAMVELYVGAVVEAMSVFEECGVELMDDDGGVKCWSD